MADNTIALRIEQQIIMDAGTNAAANGVPLANGNVSGFSTSSLNAKSLLSAGMKIATASGSETAQTLVRAASQTNTFFNLASRALTSASPLAILNLGAEVFSIARGIYDSYQRRAQEAEQRRRELENYRDFIAKNNLIDIRQLLTGLSS